MKKTKALFIILAALILILGACAKEKEITPADKFSFSGGTGRVGISCTGIEVGKEETLATIEFASDAYTYIKVGEKQYDCDHKDGTSYATIPIKLNENNTIIAETTKMSEAHEIEYWIFVYKSEDDQDKDPYELLRNDKLDDKAPFIAGLEAEKEEPVQSSDNSREFEYKNGVKLMEVYIGEAAKEGEVADPEAYLTGKTDEEDAAEFIYSRSVIKYILTEEPERLPAGLEKEAVIVKLPISNPYRGTPDISPKELIAGDYDAAYIETEDADAFRDFAIDAATLNIPCW